MKRLRSSAPSAIRLSLRKSSLLHKEVLALKLYQQETVDLPLQFLMQLSRLLINQRKLQHSNRFKKLTHGMISLDQFLDLEDFSAREIIKTNSHLLNSMEWDAEGSLLTHKVTRPLLKKLLQAMACQYRGLWHPLNSSLSHAQLSHKTYLWWMTLCLHQTRSGT